MGRRKSNGSGFANVGFHGATADTYGKEAITMILPVMILST